MRRWTALRLRCRCRRRLRGSRWPLFSKCNACSAACSVSYTPTQQPFVFFPVLCVPMGKYASECQVPNLQQAAVEADLAARQAVGPEALPSCAFFTFVNTAQALNCAAFSPDGAHVAGDFAIMSLPGLKRTRFEEPSGRLRAAFE